MNKKRMYTGAAMIGLLALFAAALVLYKSGGKKDEAEEALVPKKSGSMTLMVYLSGAELSGHLQEAADDLEELAAAGIDTDKTTVYVYTGSGSEESAETVSLSSEETQVSFDGQFLADQVYQLTADGYAAVSEWSRGHEATDGTGLADFLTLGYGDGQSRYALILREDGSGPVCTSEGEKNESTLSLTELAEGLAASPFGAERKLDWIGCDGDMMASAQTALTVSDYADRLIATEEMLPAGGWDYTLLTQSLQQLTDAYMAADCVYDRDFSCIDLSMTGQLETAMEALANEAAEWVKAQENEAAAWASLARLRLKMYSPGRAATGSDYDFVDLKSLATAMEEICPETASPLIQTLDEMMVCRSADVTESGGLSVYAPFYNEKLYESLMAEDPCPGKLTAWRQICADYLSFKNSGASDFDALAEITQNGSGAYTLSLTEAQQDTFVQTQYVILRELSENQYQCVYSGSDVTCEDGLLTAGYDGSILRVFETASESTTGVAVLREVGYADGKRRLILRGVMEDRITELEAGTPEEDRSAVPCDVYLTVDDATKSTTWNGAAALSAPIKKDDCTSEWVDALFADWQSGETPAAGRRQTVDLSEWNYLDHFLMPWKELSLDAWDVNAALLPLSEWSISTDSYRLTTANAQNGPDIRFSAEYDDGYDYVLAFQVTDVYGQTRVTEPVRLELPEEPYVEKEPTATYTPGTEEARMAADSFTLTFKNPTALDSSAFMVCEIENTSPHEIHFSMDNMIINDKYYVNSSFIQFVSVGETEDCEINILDDSIMSLIDSVESLEADISVYDGLTYQDYLYKERLCFTPSETDAPYDCTAHLGAKADQQILYEDDQMRITLECLGDLTGGGLEGILCTENLSDQNTVDLNMKGVSVNDIFFETTTRENNIPAGSRCYRSFQIYDTDLERKGISSIQSVSLMFATGESIRKLGSEDGLFYPVTLSETGDIPQSFQEGDVIYEDQGVRLIYLGTEDPEEVSSADAYQKWQFAVINDSDENIYVRAQNGVINTELSQEGKEEQEKYSVVSSTDFNLYMKAGAHQKNMYVSYVQLKYFAETPASVSFDVMVKSFGNDRIICQSGETITVQSKPYQTETAEQEAES